MRFEWQNPAEPARLDRFLRAHGLSRNQIKKLKFHGGEVYVNHKARKTSFVVQPGDRVTVQLAPELPVETVVPYPAPLAIVYEDEYILVVNKPAGVASIPDAAKGPDSMANRVKAHLIASEAESTAVHVVTRLDRETSGLMLFAKHGYVHSLLDKQLHSTELTKQYLAIISGPQALPPHGLIVLPIGRTEEFYMKRGVNPAGKRSVTEFRLLDGNAQGAAVWVTLHTGRTHQIRVHFAAINHALFGDALYAGPMAGIARQALHCARLSFAHPITGEAINLTVAPPADILSLSRDLQLAIASGD